MNGLLIVLEAAGYVMLIAGAILLLDGLTR